MVDSRIRIILPALAGALMVACFGGGSGDSGVDPPEVGNPPPPPPVNRAPTISVAAAFDALVGRAITITPVASDPDGDTLTFSISGRPAWMSFSTQTGVLSGTPSAGDVGNYNATITVSDGRLQASDQASINVSAAVAGRATLSWDAPLARVDGSPLTNLAGFKLYYGTSAGNLAIVIDVANPGARNWVIDNLTVGTWFFAASAYDQNGIESARSTVASKTIV